MKAQRSGARVARPSCRHLTLSIALLPVLFCGCGMRAVVAAANAVAVPEVYTTDGRLLLDAADTALLFRDPPR